MHEDILRRRTFCPACYGWEGEGYDLKSFPDYETPAQYKARTGKELSDKAQVWLRMFVGDKPDDVWHTCSLELALQYKSALDGKNCTATPGDTRIYHVQILIGGLEPPPDDWKGELK
jgi:hypothetical protein